MIDRTLRFWRRVERCLQVVLAIGVGFAVWLLVIDRSDDGVPPALPDTGAQFSLDLEVVTTVDQDVVYAVEQRARPYYRIFSFDPATGADETVFTVPEDAIIFGLALSPDRRQLAVSYSQDFHLDGSGLFLLDLTSGDFTEVVPAVTGVYLTDPDWATDGSSVFTTRVDRTGEAEELDVAEIDLETGSVDIVVRDGMMPAVEGDDLFYLVVDAEQARRSIGRLAASGATETIAVGDGTYDLDHLVAASPAEEELVPLQVAVLDGGDDGGLALGAPAQAHGNHDIPSTWWEVATDGTAPAATPSQLAPAVVYDAATRDGVIAYANREGLSLVTDGRRVDLIASRAIRFVTA